MARDGTGGDESGGSEIAALKSSVPVWPSPMVWTRGQKWNK